MLKNKHGRWGVLFLNCLSKNMWSVNQTCKTMRHTILSLLPVLALASAQLVANDIEPGKEYYNATKTYNPIVLDGDLSEWVGVPVLSDPKFAIPKGAGTNGTYVLFEPYNGGTWTGPDDQTSAVEVVWDAQNLYLGIIVTDDYHENAANSPWNGDSVQLMIANAARTARVALYNYALGGVEGALGEVIIQNEEGAGGTTAVITRDGVKKKTYYEIKLPAASMGLTTLTAGTKIGLGMAINDGDELTPGQKGWGGLGCHSIVFGKSPSETALLTLTTNVPGADRLYFSAINSTLDGFSFRATDKGISIVDVTSAKLTIDGQIVTLTASAKVDGAVDFTYTKTSPFAPLIEHTYSIEMKDTLGNTVTDTGVFKTVQYAYLTAADKVSVDAAKPGFIWNVHQNGSFTTGDNLRPLSQLAGSLGANFADPSAQGIAITPGTAGASSSLPIRFEIESVINMDVSGTAYGNIQPDDQMPGIPGTTSGINGIAGDIVTYLELSAGKHTFIVNSDDGFRTTVGTVGDVFQAQVAGEYSGSRGPSDTSFMVYVQEAGTYAFRTVWENTTGDGNIELLSVKTDDTKVLLNDTANGGIKAYRSRVGKGSPAIIEVVPNAGATGVVPSGAVIRLTIQDGDTSVDKTSAKLSIDGTQVNAIVTKTGDLTKVEYKPSEIWAAASQHTASISFTAGGISRTQSWQFTVSSGYTILPEADAKPVGSGQTSGFTTRLVQTSTTDGVHTLAWVENILNGAYPVKFSGSDSTSTLINYNGNGSSGNFANDTMFSVAFGSEVNDASFNDFATETVTYLELKRGYYRLGVNSDDNFWVTEGSLPGNSGRIGGIALGRYDNATGRGVADTTFDFVAPVDGVYPFRLTFENGDGGFGFEWFSVDTATGVRTLINDTATAGAIRAYRFCSAMPQNVVSIATNPPAALPIGENSKLVISAAGKATIDQNVITNNLLFSYYWTLNGQPITDTDTKGIHGPTLSIDLIKSWQAGTYQCEVSLPGFPSVKTTTVVTVVPDTTAPTLTKSQFSSDLKTIVLTFSEPMDINTLIPASFQLDGGLTLTEVTPITDPLSGNTYQVILTTSLQTEGKAYHLTVNGAADPAGNKVPTVKIPFSGFVVDPTVKMVAEFYDGIDTGSADLYTVTSNAKYQAGTPDRYLVCADFETPTWENGSYYGGRLAGVVTAPETGDYTFYITSDDYSQLFVSSDENSGNWVTSSTTGSDYVSAVTGWTNQRDWADTDVVPSDPIPLVAGHKYYIMALWYEGSGGDGCSVGWKRPSSSAIEVIPGSAISGARVNPAAASIQIGKQPVNVTVVENRVASFSLTVTNATSEFSTNATPSYQWQRNGVNVASNGNSATYSIALAQIADAGTYQCVLHVPGLSVTSSVATLTVTADTAAPVVASAGTLSTAATTVGVLFDELVDSASATTAANYTVSGANVTGAALLENGRGVSLTLDKAVASGATVKVAGVKDLVANALTTGTVNVSFNDLTSRDVGTVNATNSALFSDPLFVGSTVALGDGAFEVKAGGSDIWNNADGFHFAYKEVSGNFEAKVRVESLKYVSDNWAKAGLMVRESLEGVSRNVNCVVDPTAGANVWEPNFRAENNGATAEIPGQIPRVSPVTYPNAWIKITREDQTITAYKSTNGVDWIWLAGVTNTTAAPLPDKVLVGLCATAHNNLATTNTVAEFRDYLVTTGGAERPTVTAARSTGKVVIAYTGTLQEADKPEGPYTDIVGAVSPHEVSPMGTKFYKTRK
jgi:hypothetical protein